MAEAEVTSIICFNDVVRLANKEVGTVRFIGHTEFKKDIVFYGLNLNEANGKHNGTYNKVAYFKCRKSHGVFTEKRNIIEIVQQHSLSASFYHGQNVQISALGLKGKLLYIGLTKFDNHQNYMYGVKLSKNLTDSDLEDKIKSNQHIYVLQDHEMNSYFDANAKRSIFVRQNQLKSLDEAPQSPQSPDSKKKSQKKQKKSKKKSAAQNKEEFLKMRKKGTRRSHTMQPTPRSKSKKTTKADPDNASSSNSSLHGKAKPNSNSNSKSKAKPSDKGHAKNTSNSSSNLKLKASSSNKSNKKNSKSKKKEESAEETEKKKKSSAAKRQKLREMRMRNTIKSDLGSISRSKTASPSAAARSSKKEKSGKANKKKDTSKLRITKSKETTVDFNGCQTPIKADKDKKKSTTNNKKKKKNSKRGHKPTHSRANSTSYMIDEVKQQKQANLSVAKRSNKKKRNKKKANKDVQPRKRSNTSNKKQTKSTSSSSSSKKGNKKKKKTKKKVAQSRDDMAMIDEDDEEDDDELSYHDIINDKDKFVKYIDSKNYFYHQQFIDEEKETDDNQVVLNRVKERAPPPPMVSFFSSKSRINQRKKRALPEAPNTYSITISSRPLGFFIETRRLNTFVEDQQSGEHKQQQVEVADGGNKFHKVNAYVSSIASEQWESVVIIGSQLLSINDEDITGLSFAKIFQRLSEQALPFTIKLAAPRNNNNPPDIPTLQTMVSAETVGRNVSASAVSPTSPDSEENASTWSGISDMPRGRGQTIDESKIKKKKKFILF